MQTYFQCYSTEETRKCWGISPLEEESLLCHVLADAAPASEVRVEIFVTKNMALRHCFQSNGPAASSQHLDDATVALLRHVMCFFCCFFTLEFMATKGVHGV